MDNTSTGKEADIRFSSPYDRRPWFWIVLAGSTMADRGKMADYRPWFTDGYPCRGQYSRDFSVEYITAHDPEWVITVRGPARLRDASDRLRTLGFAVTGPPASFIRRWYGAYRRLSRARTEKEKEEEISKCQARSFSPSPRSSRFPATGP